MQQGMRQEIRREMQHLPQIQLTHLSTSKEENRRVLTDRNGRIDLAPSVPITMETTTKMLR